MEQAAAQAPGCNVQSSAQHASSAGVEVVRTLQERHQYRTEVLATVNRHQPLLAVQQRCCKVLEECAPWPAASCRLALACWGCLSGLLWVVNQLLYQGKSPQAALPSMLLARSIKVGSQQKCLCLCQCPQTVFGVCGRHAHCVASSAG